MNKGILMAAGAYLLWGFFPIYWKALHHVPALEILMHRMAWSLVAVFALLALRGGLDEVWRGMRQPRTVALFLTSALLLSVNWFVYIWGVNHGHIIETSLGYFINPLVNVLLGALFLGERMRPAQAAAVALAAAGVLYLTISYGALPWIALVLGLSFGLYGLLRKTAPLGSQPGLALETLLLAPLAIGYLLLLEGQGRGAFGSDPTTSLLLALAGPVTAVPLLLFAAGARQISLTTLGLLQYVAPTIQFLIGIWLYHEPLDPHRLIGFAIIWVALFLYSGEGLLRAQRQAASPQRAST